MHCARFWHRGGSQVDIHDRFSRIPSQIRHGHSSCMSCTCLNHLMAIRQLQFSCQVRRARCNHFRDRSTRHTYSPALRLSDDFSFDTLQKHTEKSLLLRVAHWQPARHVHGPCRNFPEFQHLCRKNGPVRDRVLGHQKATGGSDYPRRARVRSRGTLASGIITYARLLVVECAQVWIRLAAPERHALSMSLQSNLWMLS